MTICCQRFSPSALCNLRCSALSYAEQYAYVFLLCFLVPVALWCSSGCNLFSVNSYLYSALHFSLLSCFSTLYISRRSSNKEAMHFGISTLPHLNRGDPWLLRKKQLLSRLNVHTQFLSNAKCSSTEQPSQYCRSFSGIFQCLDCVLMKGKRCFPAKCCIALERILGPLNRKVEVWRSTEVL